MKTRRTLATAVAAALTAPVLLLAAGPASAATVTPPPAPPAVSATPDTFRKGASIADLEKAVEEAREAHEKAVAAQKATDEKVRVALSDDTPEAIAAATAEKTAEAAAAVHTAAVKALEEAEAKLAALPDTATPEERAAAEKAVKEARADAGTAADKKATADKELAAAAKALSDMRLAAFTANHLAQEAVKKAATALADAEKALADAKKDAEDDDGLCEGDDRLVAELTGLPAKVTAGSTVDLTVRVTNNTGETVDRAYGHIGLAPGTKDLVSLFEPQYSTAASPQWRDWNSWGIAVNVGELKPGAHADFKLRLNPAASLKDWSGRVEVSGRYERGDDCGANTTLKAHKFQVVAAPAASPSPSPSPTPSSAPSPQGGTPTPLGTTTGGTLAETGSSDALNGLALASGAAVLLGAGAVFTTRRRRATDA